MTKRKKNYQTATHTIKALKKENRMLRAEVKRLSQNLHTISQYDENNYDSEAEKLWNKEKKESLSLALENYGRYFWAQLSGGALYYLVMRIVGYFRRFRLVSTVMRIVSSVLTVVGTGAFFIFISGAIVFIVPLVLLFIAAIYIFGALSRSRCFNDLESNLKSKEIYVLFPSRGRPFDPDSCFRSTVDMLTSMENTYIVIISPYLLSSEGITDNKFFAVLRFETENVCIVRKHSFFSLRKRVFGPANNRICYIY